MNRPESTSVKPFWEDAASDPPKRGSDEAARLTPSAAWRRDIFESAERFDAKKQSRGSTRCPANVGWRNKTIYVCGGHELTTAMLLDRLWRLGLIKRWKSQPFNLQEIGGPDRVPDFLAEIADDSLAVIQVRAHRYLTEEVRADYTLQEHLVRGKGMGFHVWTNRDVVSPETSHTVRHLDYGRRYPPPPDVFEKIKYAAQSAKTLGELLGEFAWEDVIGAAAHLAFDVDCMRRLDEKTAIYRTCTGRRYQHLFTGRPAIDDWWASLDPGQLQLRRDPPARP